LPRRGKRRPDEHAGEKKSIHSANYITIIGAMLISVVNHTSGKLSDEKVQEGIRAVNRQIAHDYKPHWHLEAELRLEGAVGDAPDDEKLPELRGDAIIYLWDDVDIDDALGYHELNAAGVPFGFVFTELVKELKEPWTVTFSHEALELLGDSSANLLVAGPHPAHPDEEVFHWYEMCDAVQDEKYQVDGVWVSNFVLPLYFTPDAEEGGRNDFLGRVYKKKTLRSFGINPGGYIGFYNPKNRKHETFALKADTRAKERLKIKSKAQLTRRSMRYKLGTSYAERLATTVTRKGRVAAAHADRAARASRRAAAPRPAVEMIDQTVVRPGLGVD
jgi:hypothetical protein